MKKKYKPAKKINKILIGKSKFKGKKKISKRIKKVLG